MENKTSNNRQNNILGIAIAIIIILSMIYYLKFKQDTLETSNTYTVATVNRITESIVYYKFHFKDKLFNGSSGLRSNVEVERGERYLLKIVKDKVWISEIQYHILIPSCIKKAPNEGWEGIPDFSKICE